MLIDGTQTINDIDGKPMVDGQVPDLPEGAQVQVVNGLRVITDKAGTILAADGKTPMKDGKPLTFGDLTVTLMLQNYEDDQKCPKGERMDRMAIAEKFHKVVLPVELDSRQLELLDKYAEKALVTLSYARYARIIAAARVEKKTGV